VDLRLTPGEFVGGGDVADRAVQPIVAETIEVKGLHAVLGKGKHHKGELAAD
jgi:hypothetical protein